MAGSEPKKIKDLLTNNTIKNYYNLDQAMMDAHFADNDEFAESTARSLLENSDLPLLIRCRACMVLACADEEDSLDMAKEAVRIAQLGYDRCSVPSALENTMLANAKTTLGKVQARVDEDERENASADRTKKR